MFEDQADFDFDLTKQLAQKLKYKELSALIGCRVTVKSVDTWLQDIVEGLGALLPDDLMFLGPEDKYLHRAILKYGILDLRFETDISNLNDCDTGIAAIQTSGISLCTVGIEEILDNFSGNSAYMLLILDETPSVHPREGLKRLFSNKQTIPSEFFPRDFIVRDAAIANARNVWLSKHVYM